MGESVRLITPISPEIPFSPESPIYPERSLEAQAQKPAVLNKNHLQQAQEIASRMAGRVKNYVQSIDYKNPLFLVEALEAANAFSRVARGAIGLSDAPAILASTFLIEGIKMAIPNSGSPGESSKLVMIGEIAKRALIHEVERKVAEKVTKEGVNGVRKITQKIKDQDLLAA